MIGILNNLRKRFHPLFWLLNFRITKKSFYKSKIKNLKKSKKFGNFFIQLTRHTNYWLTLDVVESDTFKFIDELNKNKNYVQKAYRLEKKWI
tara:strand:+ start:19 stop:294 length:276 start_codon:yes stop_codon:yes gene_type:complete